jgi:hypothetical protein
MISLSAVLISFNAAEWRIEQRGVAVLSGPAWRQSRGLGFSVGSLHLEGWWLWFWCWRDAKVGSWRSHIVEDPVVEVEQRSLAASGRLRGRRRTAGSGLGRRGLEGGDAGLDGGRGRHGELGQRPEWRSSLPAVSNSARTRPHV